MAAAVPAAVKPPPIAGKVFLPDGTPLLMTISRKVVLASLFDYPELDESGEPTGLVIPWKGPSNPMEDLIVLFLCANGPDVWMAPVLCEDGLTRMLYQVNSAFMAAACRWADGTCLGEMTAPELYPVVRDLWHGAHANFVTPLAEKKTEAAGQPGSLPTGPINTPPSSPEATAAGSDTSCTSSPSTMPTGKSTPDSMPKASNASRPRKGTAAKQKPKA